MLKHPNIIYLHEIIDDADCDEIYLVTEYHSRGSLADLLKVKNKNIEKFNLNLRLEGKND
jgi:serine/threonine protein kinase